MCVGAGRAAAGCDTVSTGSREITAGCFRVTWRDLRP